MDFLIKYQKDTMTNFIDNIAAQRLD